MKQLLLLCAMMPVTILAQSSGRGYERYRVEVSDSAVFSSALGYERRVTITVPIDFQQDVAATYPLVIMFDRQNSRSCGQMLNTIDYLTSNEQMPAAVIISVESDEKHRYGETQFGISGGYGEKNASFVLNELIPLARNGFKAGVHVTLIGHSRYGYFTTYMLAQHPDEIDAVISISPFFSQKNVNLTDSVRRAVNELRPERRLFYRMAVGNDFPEDFHAMDSVLSAVAHIDAFDGKGRLFPEAGHTVTPGLIIAEALYEEFEFWARMQNRYFDNATEDLSVLDSLQSAVRMYYGDDLSFSLGTLNGKGWYFYNEGRFHDAIAAWELMMAAYPTFSEGHLYMADAERSLGIGFSSRIDAFLNSIASSRFYTESERMELMEELTGFEGPNDQ